MPNENFYHIIRHDTNLLVSLYFLLRERQVSAAANKVFIGQPAMSHQLARLREIFDDKLLVRTSGKMMITPFAQKLYPSLEKLLFDMESVMKVSANQKIFTPQKKNYKVCVSDDIYIKNATMMLYNYARELSVNEIVTFEVTARYATCKEDLNNGVIDLFFGNIDKLSENIYSQPFFESRWFWAVNNKHQLAGKQIRPDELEGKMYVDIISLERVKSIAFSLFADAMKTMRCILKTSSFNAAINFIQHTDAIVLLPESIIKEYNLSAIRFNNKYDIQSTDYVYWHKVIDADGFHRRIRNVLLKRHYELF